uniref:Uncharacterized protein n=1 Tax=Anguilla anguilla TaxID=7936 RepID=A0A0E9RG20_ANGAN
MSTVLAPSQCSCITLQCFLFFFCIGKLVFRLDLDVQDVECSMT